jgi:putative transposase
MSRKGNCLDNAVAESFFKTLKSNLVYKTYFYTKNKLKQRYLNILKFIIIELDHIVI